ncbi:hypothetical protein LUZ60_003150 [Juncus effusus]|nr:hypothetical protein LUZ60_003150 [Juncus effusus]
MFRKLTITVILVISSIPYLTRSTDDYNEFVYAGCSQARYMPGSQYESAVYSSLMSLENSATFTLYSNLTTPSTSITSLYQCRSDLSLSVCSSCLQSAVSRLPTLCPSATGAVIQLRACFLRYGNESFLGKQDTSFLYQKCGAPANSYSGDVLGMRNAALGSIQAASGPYRVGGAGYIQAESQCTGDLDVKECSDCVMTAVQQVSSACQYAGAGEMYLGKCYARYWANSGSSSSSTPTSTSSSSPREENEDETGKTLAIIIGLMAGIALIIVFLSFIRKAGSDKD